MSEEEVNLLKEINARLNRKDLPGALRLMDPEIEFDHRMADLEGTFTGIDALSEWFADVTQHFDDWTIDCDDYRDLGDRVLALGTLRTVGKESKIETEMPYTVLARFRNGLVTHYTDYGDRERALEAAGLSG